MKTSRIQSAAGAPARKRPPRARRAASGRRRIGARERERASLGLLCDLVVTCTCPYSDLAEDIENRSYDDWKHGCVENAVEQLRRVASFFERMENKNEENTRDLADVYFLIGQLYQYSEWHPESIEWFAKSVLVDDRNSFSYHCMGISYLRCGNYHNAVRSFEQELSIDEGNYFTYLQLADLYEREGKLEKAEECLKALLTRDPDNIQGIHQLIKHYERYNPAIDTGLLRKRLLCIGKKRNWMEAMLRVYYLCRERRHAEALGCLSEWEKSNRATPLLHCVKAHVLCGMNRPGDAGRELAAFVASCQNRPEVAAGVMEEFGAVFGGEAAGQITDAAGRETEKEFSFPPKKGNAAFFSFDA